MTTTPTSIDRTPKPCHHKIANHQHGTRTTYTLDRCRCLPCCFAISEYERHRVRQRAYGRAAYVDAAPARDHVRELMAAGIGWKRVAALAGLSTSVVTNLIYGRPDSPPAVRVRQATADRLLAVRFDERQIAAGSRIDATGTQRRLEALVTQGWSQCKLADRLGLLRSNFGTLMRSAEVTAGTARRVAVLYGQLWDQPPPEATHRDKIAASRARSYARDRGWLPPLAWDDETIDERDALPMLDGPAVDELDEIAVLRILSGTLRLPPFDRSPERTEAVRRMAGLGLSDAQIADRIGATRAAVCKTRERARISSAVLDRSGSTSTTGYGPALRAAAAR